MDPHELGKMTKFSENIGAWSEGRREGGRPG